MHVVRHADKKKPSLASASSVLSLVPSARLELAQLSPLPPQDSVSTNFTTTASISKGTSRACQAKQFNCIGVLKIHCNGFKSFGYLASTIGCAGRGRGRHRIGRRIGAGRIVLTWDLHGGASGQIQWRCFQNAAAFSGRFKVSKVSQGQSANEKHGCQHRSAAR